MKNIITSGPDFLKGNRPIKSSVEFWLKLHTVVNCYLLSEKNEIKRVTVLLFEMMQRHLCACANYGFVYSKDLVRENRTDRSEIKIN